MEALEAMVVGLQEVAQFLRLWLVALPKAATVNPHAYLLLPASAKSLIELHERVQLVSLCLRQRQLSRKRVCFICQNLKIVSTSGLEANFRKSCRVASGVHKILLLDPELTILAIRNQRVRYIAKSGLNRLLVSQQQLLVLCLSQ